MNTKYGLSFISDEALFAHVKDYTDDCNHINYLSFHKNIIKYINNDWQYTDSNFYDVINPSKNIFITFENKQTKNASEHLRKVYLKMQNTLLQNKKTHCYYVEDSAPQSLNTPWIYYIDEETVFHENIRCISLAQYYLLLTNMSNSYKNLSYVIPEILNNITATKKASEM